MCSVYYINVLKVLGLGQTSNPSYVELIKNRRDRVDWIPAWKQTSILFWSYFTNYTLLKHGKKHESPCYSLDVLLVNATS